MKKIFLLLVVICSLPLAAQVKDECMRHNCDIHKNKAEWFAQMRAKKLLFLIGEMELTETEEAAFSVLFNKYEEEIGGCYKAMREAKRSMKTNPTEEDYKKVVEVARNEMLKIAQLRAEYLEKLEKIVSAKKIYKFYEAEEGYKRLLIKDMGKCRGGERK